MLSGRLNNSRRAVHRQHRRGQILLITIVAMTLLMGLVLLVYNTGDQMNRRLSLQNTADATAVSGAGWMARSMNMIAMNNVTQARLLALVVVLDSVPLAAEMTVAELSEELGEADNLVRALERQLARGIPNSPVEQGYAGGEPINFLEKGLQKLCEEMKPDENPDYATGYEAMLALDRAFDTSDERDPDNGYPMSNVTHWKMSDGERGKLWQASLALGDLSDVTVKQAGLLAQANAIEYGQLNNAKTAFLSPIVPEIPVQESSTYDDFLAVLRDSISVDGRQASGPLDCRVAYTPGDPVQILPDGTIILSDVSGGAVPDWEYPHRLGPWCRLYKWRHYTRKSIEIAPGRPGTPYGAGDPELGGGVFGGEPAQVEYQTTGYMSYGPLRWAKETVYARLLGMHSDARAFVDRRFAEHLNAVMRAKQGYLFGVKSKIPVQYADKWISDYAAARSFASNPENRDKIVRTLYYQVVVLSRFKWTHNDWLRDPESYYAPSDCLTPMNNPPSARWARTRSGWYDIADYGSTRDVGTFSRLENYVWRWQRTRQTYWDPRIGVKLLLDANGKPVLQDVHYCSWYVFGGIEIRDEQEVSNPFNWADSEKDKLPRPVLLEKLPYELESFTYNYPDGTEIIGVRPEPFRFLGVAMEDDQAAVWSSKFSSANPMPGKVAVAEAKVFNSSSWDLWTQDWQVQLSPVRDWHGWVEQMRNDTDRIPGLESSIPLNTYDQITTYLENLDQEDLTDYFLNH